MFENDAEEAQQIMLFKTAEAISEMLMAERSVEGRVTVAVCERIPDYVLAAEQLVERIKHEAGDQAKPQDTWSLFVKARGLCPEIDAGEFARLWDRVTPNPHVAKRDVPFSPTHTYLITGEQVQAEQNEQGHWDLIFESGTTGTESAGPLDKDRFRSNQ